MKKKVGDKEFEFNEIPRDQVDECEIVCNTRCPYGEICKKLVDPRRPKDNDWCFEDFCGSIEAEENELDKIFIPKQGTLEKIYPKEFQIYNEDKEIRNIEELATRITDLILSDIKDTIIERVKKELEHELEWKD